MRITPGRRESRNAIGLLDRDRHAAQRTKLVATGVSAVGDRRGFKGTVEPPTTTALTSASRPSLRSMKYVASSTAEIPPDRVNSASWTALRQALFMVSDRMLMRWMVHYRMPILPIHDPLHHPTTWPDRRLAVAPMMGCTDRHFRVLARVLAPNCLLYTEMVTTGALTLGDPDRFLRHGTDAPCALQVGGNEPGALAQCAVLAEAAGYQEINLNAGCPSDRVQQGGIGACLMSSPRLVADALKAMRAHTSIPVTIKTRIGIDDADSFEHFRRFVDVAAGSGIDTFIVHARKAVLTGLSPKQNREIPPLRYDFVYRVKETYPELHFVLNGGLLSGKCSTIAATILHLESLDGIMIGRQAYADPMVLAELEYHIFGTSRPNRWGVLNEYRKYIEEEIQSGTPLRYMARHLLGFVQGLPGARRFRRYLSEHMFDPSSGIDVIDAALAESGVRPC